MEKSFLKNFRTNIFEFGGTMNKKLFFKICLIAFLAFWQIASSYIYQIRHYYNPKTKKTIFMLFDHHEMGDKKQNLEQFENFKKIYELLKKKEIMSQVLFEDPIAYVCMMKNEIKAETIKELYIKNKDCFIGNSWLRFLFLFLVAQGAPWVRYKSIDPRHIILEGTEKDIDQSCYIDFLKNFNIEKQSFTEEMISKELFILLKKIYIETGLREFIKKIKECKEDNEKMHKKVTEELDKTSFSLLLEYEALMNMCSNHPFKHTFFIAGGAHADYLSVYMKILDFELKNTWGISSYDTIKLDSNLPLSLQLKMDLAFEYILRLLEEKKSSNSSSSSSSSSPMAIEEEYFDVIEPTPEQIKQIEVTNKQKSGSSSSSSSSNSSSSATWRDPSAEDDTAPTNNFDGDKDVATSRKGKRSHSDADDIKDQNHSSSSSSSSSSSGH